MGSVYKTKSKGDFSVELNNKLIYRVLIFNSCNGSLRWREVYCLFGGNVDTVLLCEVTRRERFKAKATSVKPISPSTIATIAPALPEPVPKFAL